MAPTPWWGFCQTLLHPVRGMEESRGAGSPPIPIPAVSTMARCRGVSLCLCSVSLCLVPPLFIAIYCPFIILPTTTPAVFNIECSPCCHGAEGGPGLPPATRAGTGCPRGWRVRWHPSAVPSGVTAPAREAGTSSAPALNPRGSRSFPGPRDVQRTDGHARYPGGLQAHGVSVRRGIGAPGASQDRRHLRERRAHSLPAPPEGATGTARSLPRVNYVLIAC